MFALYNDLWFKIKDEEVLHVIMLLAMKNRVMGEVAYVLHFFFS